jgi:PP-loop superfamily ATP-utilizing enzyme
MKDVLTAFLQSEKIRAGLFWTSRMLMHLKNLYAYEGRGAMQVIRLTLQMVWEEVRLARKLAPQESWVAVETNLDLAMVMIEADAPAEALPHVREAFTQVTEIGKHQFTLMKEKGIF